MKLQNPFGTCWGFGATAAAEISLLGSGLAQADGFGAAADPERGIEELDLSEKHLAYFSFAAINDRNDSQNGEGMQYAQGTTAAQKFNSGGYPFYATGRYAAGMGPNLEDRGSLAPEGWDLLTYRGKNGYLEFRKADVANDGNYSLAPIWYSEKDDWSIPEEYRFYAAYRLKESYELPSPAGKDETGAYVYNEAGTNAIKEQLLARRGVALCFHAESYLPGQDPTEKTYMSENWAHYTWETQYANHAVCVVGWDDNYPKENFLEGHQPPADGAWIVKNSWGASTNSGFVNNGYRYWGVRDEDGNATGYFWLSYYDMSLSLIEAFAFDKSNMEKGYYVEQYDYMPVGSINEVTVDTETGMANVFQAEADSVLSELSFQTATPGTTVTYAVYLLDKDFEDPVSGDPVVSGSAAYPYGGYHKVTLPESRQVEMQKGQLFSVAVKQQTPAGSWSYVLPTGFGGEALRSLGYLWDSKGVVNEKESFFYTDSAWHDMSDKDFVHALLDMEKLLENEGLLDILKEDSSSVWLTYDNFPIKAYLDPGDGAERVYGQSSIPLIVSTCAGDGTCPANAFSDLKPGAWYHDGVHWALDQGVMKGVRKDSFRPEGAATRAMVVTMLWRLAGEPESKAPAGFTDVKDGAWYAGAVAWAAETGIVTGYSDTTFGPSDNVTREQLAVILYRCSARGISAEDLTDPREPLPFTDAGDVHGWAQDAVYWAWDEGILNGKTETLLAPRDNAVRAEVAAMLMRACAMIGV